MENSNITIKMNGKILNKILKCMSRKKKTTIETKIVLIKSIFRTLLILLDPSILLFQPVKKKAYRRTNFLTASSRLLYHSSFLPAKLEKQQILGSV